MKKLKYSGLMLAIVLGAINASALVAPDNMIEAPQPDGSTVLIRQTGDAFNHKVYSADGYLLTVDADGYYVFAGLDDSGQLCPTAIRAINVGQRSSLETEKIQALDQERIMSAMVEMQTKPGAKQRVLHTRGPGLSTTRFPSKGEGKSIVVLVEYADNSFTIPNPKEYYEELLNGEDFSDNGAYGSVRKYFIDNSEGAFSPHFDVYGPVKLPREMKYYGQDGYWGTDENAYMMAVEACELLDDEVDFSQYDYNGDGMIDNVYIFYAGYGQQDSGIANAVWPHSWDIDYGTYATYFFDGVRLNHYACSNELRKKDNKPDGIGPFCHEFSHVMGLPDLYQTDTTLGTAYTPESWSIIASGSYNNMSRTPAGYSGYERYALDWIEPDTFVEEGEYILPSLQSSNKAFIVQTSKENEYFIIENRQREGWDSFLPGHGLLVWHIDFDLDVWDYNEVNNNPKHQRVDIVEADPSSTTHAKDCFPGRSNVTSFTSTGKPAFVDWSGKPVGIDITDIKELENGDVSFNVSFVQEAGVHVIDKDFVSGDCTVYNLTGTRLGLFKELDKTVLTPGIYIVVSASGESRKIRL